MKKKLIFSALTIESSEVTAIVFFLNIVPSQPGVNRPRPHHSYPHTVFGQGRNGQIQPTTQPPTHTNTITRVTEHGHGTIRISSWPQTNFLLRRSNGVSQRSHLTSMPFITGFPVTFPPGYPKGRGQSVICDLFRNRRFLLFKWPNLLKGPRSVTHSFLQNTNWAQVSLEWIISFTCEPRSVPICHYLIRMISPIVF
jgi:hypothetical protein